MYLLFAVFFCLGGSLGGVTFAGWWGGASVTPIWTSVVPYAAVNIFAFWSGFRRGRLERLVRFLVLADLGLAGTYVLVLLVYVLASRGEPVSTLIAVGGLAILFGTIGLCRRVYLDRPFPRWLMPVSGRWARRFAAGVAILLLQAISPAMIAALAITFVGGGAFGAVSAENVGFRIAGAVCLMTAPLYLAPIYRLLVTGKITAIPAALAPSLLFGEHRALHPDDAFAFARLVARLELPLQEHLSRSGNYPYEAAAMARECLLGLWLTGNASRFDHLSLGDLPVLAAAALKQAPMPMPTLEPNELWTHRALNALPDSSRESTRQWLRDPDSYAWIVRTRGDSEAEVAASLRVALHQVLQTIAGELPARNEQAAPKVASL